MISKTPRLRMIAGPNGSGKSRIREILNESVVGIFVNSDEIQEGLASPIGLDFSLYQIEIELADLREFAAQHLLWPRTQIESFDSQVTLKGTRLTVGGDAVLGYFAALVADFIRKSLIAKGTSFTFETVMSSSDKLETLQSAREAGYRTYLYYVATEDSSINVARVQYRVQMGGHDVPEQKICERYTKSLNNLLEAVRCTNRAYVWDNSGSEPLFIAEVTDGSTLEFKSDYIPSWFKTFVLDKLSL